MQHLCCADASSAYIHSTHRRFSLAVAHQSRHLHRWSKREGRRASVPELSEEGHDVASLMSDVIKISADV